MPSELNDGFVVSRAGNEDGPALPVDTELYNSPNHGDRVFIVQRCRVVAIDMHRRRRVTGIFPTAHRTLRSAIDWATLDAGEARWHNMRFHVVEPAAGVYGKIESDFFDEAQSEYFEIFEMRLE